MLEITKLKKQAIKLYDYGNSLQNTKPYQITKLWLNKFTYNQLLELWDLCIMDLATAKMEIPFDDEVYEALYCYGYFSKGVK